MLPPSHTVYHWEGGAFRSVSTSRDTATANAKADGLVGLLRYRSLAVHTRVHRSFLNFIGRATRCARPTTCIEFIPFRQAIGQRQGQFTPRPDKMSIMPR